MVPDFTVTGAGVAAKKGGRGHLREYIWDCVGYGLSSHAWTSAWPLLSGIAAGLFQKAIVR